MLLNLDQFGAASGLGPQPKYWSFGVFVVSLVLFFFVPKPKPKNLLYSPLLWWAVAYLLFSILWIFPTNNLEVAWDGMTMVITTSLYVGTAILVYPSVRQSERLWSITLWLALVLAVSSVLLEYFEPSVYIFSKVGRGITGRSAGLYMNPNVAAQTILLILACLLLRSPPRTSLLAALVALIGILVTFSRAGLVVWLALFFVSAVRGNLPRSTLPVLLALVAGVGVAGSLVLDALSAWISPENRNTLDRLAWFLGQGDLSDSAAGEREWITSFAWGKFLEAPLLGHGLGYMSVWEAGVGTHNIILRHLVEYGVLGFLIFPLLLWCGIQSSDPRSDRVSLWLIAAVVLMMSFFSHNMLEQGGFVFPWLAVCLMPYSMARSYQRRTQSRVSSAEVMV
jgi:O-antigen ligase